MTDPIRLPRSSRRDPQPPGHLSRASRALWRSVVAQYNVPSHELTILAAALEALDRMTQAREAIAVDGPYVAGRWGPKAHPALAIERDSRLAMLRAWRALKLPDDAPAPARDVASWSS